MRNFFQRAMAVLLVVLLLLTCAACGSAPDIELPPLPTYTDETPSPTVSPKPSPVAVPTPTPEQTLQPEISASPTPTVTPTPSPAPTVQSDVPIISISGETLPADMLQYNVAALRGVISTDKGSITDVTAMLTDESGEIVQSCSYQPVLQSFSLAGTVNAQLQFAVLQPGTYFYVLNATAENNGLVTEKQIFYHRFTVFATQEEMNKSELGGEDAPSSNISIDSSNAATIWNFLIVYLDNPYGAAGVLANIDYESGCDPKRVHGDFSEGFTFSHNYTQLVDEGNVNRDSFIWAVPAEGYGSGYGLCQWTLDRKEGLYDLAKKDGTSVGDLNTQCTYLIMELELNYPELSSLLKTTTDAREAAREFFYVYEQGSTMGNRADIAEDYLEAFAS